MKWFDTHCHLQHPLFDADRDLVMKRLQLSQMKLLCVSSDIESSKQAINLAAEYPDDIYAAVGIHPSDTSGVVDFSELESLSCNQYVKAIGETGLDFYHNHSSREDQYRSFLFHLELAKSKKLPVVLHARESIKDVLDIIEPYIESVPMVWHCWSGSRKFLSAATERAAEMGLYFGISGMITFDDQKGMRELITRIPDRQLLLDSDAPYLQPHPKISTHNEPVFCHRIADELAKLRNVSVDDISRITTYNAVRFLNLSAESLPNTFVYPIRSSLYISLTTRCNNACVFCYRNRDYIVKGHNLNHDHEPSSQEIIAALGDLSLWKEVVFCGLGEPTLRLDVLKETAAELKRLGKRVRLNTNGQANREHKRNIAPELKGLVDVVSVSLNTANSEEYDKLCRPSLGEKGLEAACEFVKSCLLVGLEVLCTAVEFPNVDTDAVKRLAESLGAVYRGRSFVDVG